MKSHTQKIKWITTSLLALTLCSGAQAFGSWNNWNTGSTLGQIQNLQFNYLVYDFPIINCVNVPELPAPFQRTTTRTIVVSDGGAYSELEADITQVTPTFISADTTKYMYSGIIEVEGGINSAVFLELGEITSTFSIAGNYKDITEETYAIDHLLFEDNHRYAPFLRKASGTICENQTWNSDYHHTSEVITDFPISAIFPENTINTIESVDVEKIVEAGTFTTYQHKVEYGLKTITNWVDIETGVLVASEARDGSTDELLATKELISFIIPIVGEPLVMPKPLTGFTKVTKTKSVAPTYNFFGKK
jgi:hypothetical protein